MSVWLPESVGLITAHHLVCPLTWIRLLQLPIHQSARAPPPCVPACLVSVTLPVTHTEFPSPVPYFASTTVTPERQSGACPCFNDREIQS